MNEKTLAHARKAIVVCAVLVILSFVWTATRSRSEKPVTLDEQVFCASAVCFYDSVRGKECLEFTPTVSKLIPIPDLSGDSVRLVIEATGKECKERR